MLKFASFDIVFQEVPDEVSLAINLTNCPNRCEGCHSPHLRQDVGSQFDSQTLESLVETYRAAITCVCFMGGDAAPDEVAELATFAKKRYDLKTAWYSGKAHLPKNFDAGAFDFVKLGPYAEKFGGLKSRTTNQHFYRIEKGEMRDITETFWK